MSTSVRSFVDYCLLLIRKCSPFPINSREENNRQAIRIELFIKVLSSLAVLLFLSDETRPQRNFFTNYRIYPSTVTQTEVLITKDPFDDNILFASANAIRFQPSLFISEGIYVTTNGGSSWYGTDSCSGSPIQLHGGDPGIAIDKNGTFILTRLGRQSFTGLYSHYSTDRGITWSAQKTITTVDLERATIETDANPQSSYFGRTYAGWVVITPPFSINVTYTDDGAVSWAPANSISDINQRRAGGEVEVTRDGLVMVTWANLLSNSPYTEISAGFAISSNGGVNWDLQESAFSMNGIQGIMTQKQNIRVNSNPRIAVDKSGGDRDSWIYIVTTEKNNGGAGNDPDIIIRRSTNNGATWSAGIRVNQDAINNGKIQYFPAVHVDVTGGINIIYYDDRNTTSDSTSVFLSCSTNGGDSWVDYELSDHNFKPVPIGGLGQGYQGDNIDIISAGTKLYPVWMDNSIGIYQIWTAPVDISLLDSPLDDPDVPSEFKLSQNYPNPFNPSTKIIYTIPGNASGTLVRIVVFDILGNEIEKLVNEEKPAGSFEVNWNTSNLPSGVYFYRFQAGQFVQTRKMILMK